MRGNKFSLFARKLRDLDFRPLLKFFELGYIRCGVLFVSGLICRIGFDEAFLHHRGRFLHVFDAVPPVRILHHFAFFLQLQGRNWATGIDKFGFVANRFLEFHEVTFDPLAGDQHQVSGFDLFDI